MRKVNGFTLIELPVVYQQIRFKSRKKKRERNDVFPSTVANQSLDSFIYFYRVDAFGGRCCRSDQWRFAHSHDSDDAVRGEFNGLGRGSERQQLNI